MSGEIDKAKGRMKQAAGDLTDDDDLKDEGEVDELAGKAKGEAGDIAGKAKDTVDKVKDKITEGIDRIRDKV